MLPKCFLFLAKAVVLKKKLLVFLVFFFCGCYFFLFVTSTLLLLAKSSDRLWNAEKVCVENNSRVLSAVYTYYLYFYIISITVINFNFLLEFLYDISLQFTHIHTYILCKFIVVSVYNAIDFPVAISQLFP